MAAFVDFQIPIAQDVAMGFTGCELFVPGQVAFDAGDEFIGTERLDDIVIGTEAEAAYLVDIFLAGRDHEDGNVFLFPYSPAKLEAIAARQHDIQQDEVESLSQGFRFACFTISGDIGTEAIGF